MQRTPKPKSPLLLIPPTPPQGPKDQSRKHKYTQAFSPTEKQEQFLRTMLDPFDPPATWIEGLERIGLERFVLKRWCRDPAFVEWWNRAYTAGVKVYTSTVLHELIGLIRDPKASKTVKARAIREFLERFSAEQQRWERETALRALVDTLTPSAKALGEHGGKLAFAVREHPDLGMQVVAQVEPGTPNETQHNVTYQKYEEPIGPLLEEEINDEEGEDLCPTSVSALSPPGINDSSSCLLPDPPPPVINRTSIRYIVNITRDNIPTPIRPNLYINDCHEYDRATDKDKIPYTLIYLANDIPYQEDMPSWLIDPPPPPGSKNNTSNPNNITDANGEGIEKS